MEIKRYCFTCKEYVEPEYITTPCVAQYGHVVVAKGFCPYCERQIVAEHIIEGDGLIPPKREWS